MVGQDGSVTGGIPCVIQGKVGTVQEMPFEIYKDPMSDITRIRQREGKVKMFAVDNDSKEQPKIIKNNEGIAVGKNMSFKLGRNSYRLDGNKFILEK